MESGKDAAFLLRTIHYSRTDASVFARCHLPKLFSIAFGIKLRVGVELVEHVEQGVLNQFLAIERIYVVAVKFAIERGEDIEILHQFEVVVSLCLDADGSERQGQRKQQYCADGA